MANKQDLRSIYELLDKLCKIFSPDRHKEILKKVTGAIADSSQQGFLSNLCFDESLVVTKIKNHLSAKSDTNLSLFLSLHGELFTLTTPKFRSSILTLLLYLSDMESKLPKSSNDRYLSDSVFTLPVRHRSVEPSTSMDQLHQGISSRITSTTSFNSESNLKLVNFRRKIPSSSSTDSILGLQTPDTETALLNCSKSEELVQEAIYALTGKSGKSLKKDVTGEFKLDMKAPNLNVQDAITLLRLAEIGRLHNEIQKFTDANSEFFLYGLFGQGLISQLENELVLFYGLVAHLQDNLHSQRSLSVVNENKITEPLTLVRLNAILSEPHNRLRNIKEILQTCKNLKGGPLSSALYEHLYNGYPVHQTLAASFLKATCRPLQNMLSHWLLEGEIHDPHNEFFIEEIKEYSSESLWHHKYRVVQVRLPMFISKQLAENILVSGKSINFLREVCEDRTPIKGREELKLAFENNIEDLFGPVPDSKLHQMIDQVYLNTSKKVLDIALGQYRLLEHLQAMRKYLLLGQGDFINLLMDNLKDELDRPAKELYQHALFSIVAASVRATSQFDDAEILKHLDVKLVHAIDGDRGWDIFTLHYNVHGPLATILELNMGKYQELFKPLWKAKHTEFVLDNIWKEQMLNSKFLRSIWQELNPITYRLHAFTSEMIHFIHQMQYYILFEVIECSWVTFIKRVQSAKALDEILKAHESFLNDVRVGIFLDGDKKETLYLHLDIIYDSIVKLEDWQQLFYNKVFKEVEARKTFELGIIKSEKAGKYGVTTEKRLERDNDLKIFEQMLSTFKKNLDSVGNGYEKYVNDFLLMLTSSKDQNLQRLYLRLDFNEFYKKRNQRLKQTLTYEHMRMSGMGSSGIFTRGNISGTPIRLNSSILH